MFRRIKDHFEKKRKDSHEMEIKKALSEKFFSYHEEPTPINHIPDVSVYTEVTIFGKKMMLKKEQITILDVTGNTLSCV